jgi:hypothetical protein
MNVDAALSKQAAQRGFKWGITSNGGRFYSSITCMGGEAIRRAQRCGVAGTNEASTEAAAVTWVEAALRRLLATP